MLIIAMSRKGITKMINFIIGMIVGGILGLIIGGLAMYKGGGK